MRVPSMISQSLNRNLNLDNLGNNNGSRLVVYGHSDTLRRKRRVHVRRYVHRVSSFDSRDRN